MSGVFGLFSKPGDDNLPTLINAFGQELNHHQWTEVDTYFNQDAGVSFGKVGIGIFNKDKSPLRSQDQKIMIWFTGELQRHNLSQAYQDRNEINDPEIILSLYNNFGEAAFVNLEGTFQLALWDREKETTYLVTDRFASYPLYYSEGDFGFIFSPEYKVILSHPNFKKEINLNALAEYIKFQRVLGTKSFFQGIYSVPYSSYLRFNHNSQSFHIERYWDFDQLPEIHISIRDGINELAKLFKSSVERNLLGKNPIGLYLSGGLDSRMICSVAVNTGYPLQTITYGNPKSADAIISQKVADKLNTRHNFLPFTSGDWVLDYVDDHLKIVEGAHTWQHLHGISTIGFARERFNVQLNGFLGGLFLGYKINQPMIDKFNMFDDVASVSETFYLLNQESTWPGVNEAEDHLVFNKKIAPAMHDRAYYTFFDEFGQYLKFPGFKRWEIFSLIETQMKLFHKYVIFYRSGLESRCPFLDYDLVNFALSTQPEIRKDRNKIFHLIAPDVSSIPYNEDLMPPTENPLIYFLAEFRIKGKRLFNKLRPGTFKNPFSLDVDYETYLRSDLKEWAKNILLDERTLDRGIFNPDFIHSIWERTQLGEVHTLGKIAPILSYELILRKFFDE